MEGWIDFLANDIINYQVRRKPSQSVCFGSCVARFKVDPFQVGMSITNLLLICRSSGMESSTKDLAESHN